MHFATLEEIKAAFEPAITDATLDDLITLYMDARGKTFDQVANRQFESGEYTEIVDGGGDFIFLKNTPIDSVVTLIADEDRLFPDEDAWDEDADDFSLMDQEEGRIYGPFTGYGRKAIKVIYLGGYDPPDDVDPTAEIPADLKLAFIRQVVHDVKRRKDIGLTTIAFKDGSITKPSLDDLLPQVLSVVEAYRVWNV